MLNPEIWHQPTLGEKHKIEIHPSPWEQEPRMMTCEYLTPKEALTMLELKHPDIRPEILDSVIPSEWYSIDNGRMYLEIRNPDALPKKGHLPIVFTDFDDCVLSTTNWHNKEYEFLNTDVQLNSRQIIINPDHAKSIYEMSKIFVPEKAEHEKRYTPRLNLILLSQYAYFLPSISRNKALEIAEKICAGHTQTVTQTKGDKFLLDLKIDHDIRNAIENNSPTNFLHRKFVSDLFQSSHNHLHMIVTRGKPEGLLGQIYKVHGCGVFNYPVDLVLYTNDLKADALLVLSKIVPGMRSAPIKLYDDNPKEVLPYLTFIRDRKINNIEVVHVKHPDAKQRDVEVGETPIESRVDEETQTRFDVYHPNRLGTI